jgi:hypothetical protein
VTELMIAAGLLHLGLLVVSLSVPRALDLRGEFARLSPIVRKMVWVHGAYISGMIAAFGAITLLEARALAAGEMPILAALMAAFWLGRLGVQLFYFTPEHWPKGRLFAAGRSVMTAMFAYWSAVYSAAAAVGWLT